MGAPPITIYTVDSFVFSLRLNHTSAPQQRLRMAGNKPDLGLVTTENPFSKLCYIFASCWMSHYSITVKEYCFLLVLFWYDSAFQDPFLVRNIRVNRSGCVTQGWVAVISDGFAWRFNECMYLLGCAFIVWKKRAALQIGSVSKRCAKTSSYSLINYAQPSVV